MFRYTVEVQTEGGWERYSLAPVTYMNAWKTRRALQEGGYRARIMQDGKEIA